MHYQPNFDYKKMLSQVKNLTIHKIYSKFNFFYFPSAILYENPNNHSQNNIEDLLQNYLKESMFITCNFTNSFDILESDEINDSNFISKSFSDKENAIICSENICLILNNVNPEIIKNIFDKFKNNQVSILNLNDKDNDISKCNEEITSFCSFFNEIDKNKFLKYTIRPIACYLIRRHFYPTFYFYDQSFFVFDQFKMTNEQKIKAEILSLLHNFDYDVQSATLRDVRAFKNMIRNQIKPRNFQKSEFIKLRTLFSNSEASFNLVIHIESLYVFMMKSCSILNEREVKFCEDYSHRCLCHFYGFVKDNNNKILGFIYELMSNGTIKNLKQNLFDEMHRVLTISRVIRGIEYLHSNKHIHRDIKPSNVLFDHNYLPYIIDFETIREIKTDDEISTDYGTFYYTSPEYDKGESISYPTDIYSFGLFIYFLYEKKNLIHYQSKENLVVPTIKTASKNIQKIFESCLKIDPQERPTAKQIISIINEELNSFDYLEHFLIQDKLTIYSPSLIEFLFESLLAQIESEKSLHVFLPNIFYFQILFTLKITEGESSLYNQLGIYFISGKDFKKDYAKAKDYFEKAAKQNYPKALSNLGTLYFNGQGVERNVIKAKECFESAAEQGDQTGLLNFGDFCLQGFGGEIDYKKAKECYEKLANMGNKIRISNLALIYLEGRGVKQDFQKAKQYLEQAAKLNDSTALLNLGCLYVFGNGVKRDYTIARGYFERAAQQQNPNAFYHLAYIYLNGYGVKQSYTIAKQYSESAIIINNHSGAQLILAYMYLNGFGVTKNIATAKKYIELSANQNNTDAQVDLGILYKNGWGVEKDYKKAQIFFELASKQNNVHGFLNLGFLYMDGYGVKKDYLKAKEYFDRAAEFNNSTAFLELGNLYYEGYGVDKNCKKALKYFEKSANLDNVYALFNLGLLYCIGETVTKDILRADNYFARASKTNDSNILYRLGYLYEKGVLISQDIQKSIKYYQAAGELNNSKAILHLGYIYLDGIGVDKNYSEAKKYFELSSNFGNSDAFLELGCLYFRGIGVEQNYIKARQYFEVSARLNNSNAYLSLGILYAKGLGVEKNMEQAVAYFEASASLNNADAFFNLGLIYDQGLLGKQDLEKAKNYYELAAQMNHFDAILNLANLYMMGRGVPQSWEKAKEYNEQLAKHDISIAYLNLGIIYFYGLSTPKDILKARYYFDLSAKQNNSTAILDLGVTYLDEDKPKAIEYYKKAANLNNSIALIVLGQLHEEDQQYEDAFKCYEKSSLLLNYFALILLGKLYENGLGVKQNYSKAKECYDLASEKKISHAFFHLANLYSNGTYFDVDIPKAINYFKKSFKKESNIIFTQNSFFYIEVKYIYFSKNDLGLIYITYLQNVKKAEKYLKDAALNEYQFGQNNFGLLSQFYLDEIGNAAYMYEKASKAKFALAEYNLGFLKEKEKKTSEAIQLYMNCSDHEDEPLIFQRNKHFDLRLEISKTFIICFTNLKLVYYYLNESKEKGCNSSNSTECELEKAKKYFIRSFSKLKTDDEDEPYQFKFSFMPKEKGNIFSYLKTFILNFPKFNLINQPNISSDLKQKFTNINDNSEYNNSVIDQILKDKSYYFHDANEKQLTFANPGELFDYVVQKNEVKNEFIKQIHEILLIMESILYTPPYLILFGRISLVKPKPKTNVKDVNSLFYEGFKE